MDQLCAHCCSRFGCPPTWASQGWAGTDSLFDKLLWRGGLLRQQHNNSLGMQPAIWHRLFNVFRV